MYMEPVTSLMIIFGFWATAVGIKYSLYKCTNDNIQTNLEVINELPPKYEAPPIYELYT
jgi:hypothetical protein